MTFQIVTRYQAEYFNRIAQATIPAGWTAEVDTEDYGRLYAEGRNRPEAIAAVIAVLKSYGYSGTAKPVHVGPKPE